MTLRLTLASGTPRSRLAAEEAAFVDHAQQDHHRFEPVHDYPVY